MSNSSVIYSVKFILLLLLQVFIKFDTVCCKLFTETVYFYLSIIPSFKSEVPKNHKTVKRYKKMVGKNVGICGITGKCLKKCSDYIFRASVLSNLKL